MTGREIDPATPNYRRQVESSEREFCGGCDDQVRPECRGSLSRIGAYKVHWECWSDCNLPCSFCYRTRGTPLRTDEAENLIAAIATAGPETVVFTGGDPSLRSDIGHLLAYARVLGLITEVHTNAQYAPEHYRLALTTADYVGLSLDGPSAEVHDAFRGKRGNFKRVLDLFDFLEAAAIPVVVRTVLAQPNHKVAADIGELLVGRGNLLAWHLLEFSPVGSGFQNSWLYALERTVFDQKVDEARRRFGDTIAIVDSHLEDKSGTYVLVTPDGQAYGTLSSPQKGRYPVVGSMLRDHLSELAGSIGFRPERHEELYLAGEDRRRRKIAALAEGNTPTLPVSLE